MAAAKPRTKLFVDAKIQGLLILRALLYWAAVVATIGILLLCWTMVQADDQRLDDKFVRLWETYRLPLFAAALVLPLMIGDIIKLSNRFVGPIYRLRKGLDSLAAGEPVRMMKFREGDLWSEIADQYNAVASRIERLERQLAALKADAEEQSPPCVEREPSEQAAGV